MANPDTKVEKSFQRNIFTVVPVRHDPTGTIVHERASYSRVVSPEEQMAIEFLYTPPESLALGGEVHVTGKVKGELDAFAPIRIPFLGSIDATSDQAITIESDVIERYIAQLIPDKNTPAYYTIFWTSGEGQTLNAQLVVYQRRDHHMILPVPVAPPDRRQYRVV